MGYAVKRPGSDRAVYEQMREKLSSERDRRLYVRRKITIEPVFGQVEFDRRMDRFMRRGRAAAGSEWRSGTATTTCSSSTATGSPTPPDTGGEARPRFRGNAEQPPIPARCGFSDGLATKRKSGARLSRRTL
jgi:hypothetical protein